jgi:RNA polymerase sigma factor (TIGR02999 family)
MGEVTQILEAVHHGDATASEALLPLVYEELRQLAAHRMARERPGQTLQPTALVHEAYLRLAQGGQGQRWDGRGHFFAAAGEAMRRILVEAARRKRCRKHGGEMERVELEQVEIASPLPDDQLLQVDDALTRLAMLEPRAAEVVKLCFFVGLTQAEAAKEMGISRATAERLWSFARAWLFQQIDRPSGA